MELSKDAFSRRNRIIAQAELWRPPNYAAGGGLGSSWLAAIRRFFDPDAKTVFNDLKVLLRDAQGTVLDVGCGAQPYRALLPRGCRYIGIDTVDAKEHFGYELPDTVYFDAGGAWPVEDASISVVLASEVLEHVLEPAQFLGLAMRSLRPGGKLILTVPFAARWHYIPRDYWRYTPSSLGHLLDQANFKDVRVYSRGNPLSVACYKVMALFFALIFIERRNKALQWLIRAAGLLGLPLLLFTACLLNLSVRFDWGDDCLGYTVLAEKPGVATE